MEVNFTEVYRNNINEHIAIREARCLQAQFPAVLDEIEEKDRLAGRTFWGWVGFSPHNAPNGAAYGYFCHEHKIIEAIERGNIPVEQRESVHEMLHFWKKETSKSKVEAAFTKKMLPILFRDEIVSLPYNFKPLIANPIYRMAGVFVDYEKLLRLGNPHHSIQRCYKHPPLISWSGHCRIRAEFRCNEFPQGFQTSPLLAWRYPAGWICSLSLPMLPTHIPY